MYLWMTTFKAATGREGALVAWAKEIAALIDKGCQPPGPCQVLIERMSDFGTVYLTMQVRDSAEIDRIFAWAGQDQEFQALMRRGIEAGIQVPGSRRDRLLLYR